MLVDKLGRAPDIVQMKLKSIIVGLYEVNCYLYWNEKTFEGIIIDPGADFDQIKKEIENNEIKPIAVLLTHGHGDHIAAVSEILEHYKIPLYAGEKELPLLLDANLNMSAGMGVNITTPRPEFLVADNEILNFPGFSIKVLATPGHSPGGVCFYDEKNMNLFTGDTLFFSSIGRTDFPGCSMNDLLDSINNKILTLPDEIKCFPGHGPATTVGGERINNPFLQGGYYV